MIVLTPEQRQELEQPQPMAIDPQTKQTYVLVNKEVYDRWQALLAVDEYDPDEGAAFINEIMADDDSHDPLLGTYQDYGKAP
jgi:6-phosphogluconolactonase (cycloisomerase 2 family)